MEGYSGIRRLEQFCGLNWVMSLIETYEEKKTQPLYQAVMEVIMQANWKEAEVERKMCEALKLR